MVPLCDFISKICYLSGYWYRGYQGEEQGSQPTEPSPANQYSQPGVGKRTV